MPDYPYIYPEGPARAVETGGTRVRVLRRRPRQPEAERPAEHDSDPGEPQWRTLLEEAVRALNEEFERTGAPYFCDLLEDDSGFVLSVEAAGSGPNGSEETEEVLEPADLPAWLSRLHARLGILVDRRA